MRIACEEKGVAYRLTPAKPHSPEVNAIHPLGKVPAMRHGQFQLFESKAIATYADRAFPGPKLFPDDAKLSATIEQWVSVTNTGIFPVFVNYLRSQYFPNTADGRPRMRALKSSSDFRSRVNSGFGDRGLPCQPRIRWDSRSRTMIP
ncbi:MAG: glutathione S-transferase family protein, partial [Methylocella sp.]